MLRSHQIAMTSMARMGLAVIVLFALIMTASADYAVTGEQCYRPCGSIHANKCRIMVRVFGGLVPLWWKPCINRDCEVSAWGSWGTCNAACGGGRRSRKRSITQTPYNSGAGCPSLSQSATCNSGSCWNLKLPAYGDPVPTYGAYVTAWNSNFLSQWFAFKCRSGMRTYHSDRNPRYYNRIFFKGWTSSGIKCTYCKPGKKATGADSCEKCPPKYDQPSASQTSCRQCAVGRYSNSWGTVECHKCDPGSYQPAKKQSSCHLCEPGRYQDLAGKADCKDCPRGRYAPLSGQTSCDWCPVGEYQHETGKDRCLECECDVGCKDCVKTLDNTCVLQSGFCAADGGAGIQCFKNRQRMADGDVNGVQAISQPCFACQSSVNPDTLIFRETSFRARKEIAFGKPTTASSSSFGSPSDAVDGNDAKFVTHDGTFERYPSTCFATGSSLSAPRFWRVDLEATFPLERIQVYTPGNSPDFAFDGMSSSIRVQVRLSVVLQRGRGTCLTSLRAVAWTAGVPLRVLGYLHVRIVALLVFTRWSEQYRRRWRSGV